MRRCGLNPLKDVQGRESISQCHGPLSSPHELYLSASAVLIVLLMMDAESTRNMQSNLAEKNNYNCLKLHHVGYLMKHIEDNLIETNY
jgi:hypothetical protein